MMPLTLNGRDVLALDLLLPSVGAWVASGEVEGDQPLTGPASFEDGGAAVFAGTVRESTSYRSRTGFLVVGGADGLRTLVRPQSYRSATLALPVDDILRQAGETLGEALSSDLASYVLASWSVGEWTAGRAISDLAELVGASWWVDPDGGVRLAVRGQPIASTALVDLVEHDLAGRTITLAPAPGSEWALRPNTVVHGKTIRTARFLLSGSSLRVRCEYEDSLDGLVRAIAQHGARRTDYLALYPAEVYSQDSDGTLQVFPDSPAIPKLAGVPLKLPAPGTVVKVTKGARVLVGFEGGNPSRPFAIGFESAGFQSIALGNGTKPAARVGDQVTIFVTPGVPVPVSGTLSGNPFVGAATFTSPLIGVIGTGNPQVLE